MLAVLLVEDSESDEQLIVRALKKAGYDLALERVETAAAMQSALNRQTWDIVISDYNLPQFNGRAALDLLKAAGQDIPFIIVSGAIGEETAVAVMKAGAHDYLMKNNLARLAPTVARELEQAEDRRKRKKAEEALRVSELDLKEAQAIAHIGNWKWNVKTREIFWSDEMYRIFGIDPNSYTGRLGDAIAKVIHPDDLHLVLPSNAPTFAKQKPVEYRILLPGGSMRYIWAKAGDTVFDDEGNPAILTGIAQDITERKQAEDQLHQLSRAVEYSSTSILITDVNGNIEYVNPKFTELTGYTLEEARGQTPRILKSGKTAPEVYTELWDTILSGKDWNGDILNRKKNGEVYWENASISSITNADGKITHFVAVNEDITARKESEEKIRSLNAELEKLAATDYLTNLYNRRYFMERGTEEFKRAKRSMQPLSLVMLDIDKFKNINDTYGHETGDFALKQVVNALKANLREIDILGRMGGDEFTVLLPYTTVANAALIADRVRKDIENTTFQTMEESFTISITISAGVAEFTDKTATIDDLLRNADTALYQAKNSGRNRVIIYKSNSA